MTDAEEPELIHLSTTQAATGEPILISHTHEATGEPVVIDPEITKTEKMHGHEVTVNARDVEAMATTLAIAVCPTCRETFTAASGNYDMARNIIIRKHRKKLLGRP